MGDRILIRCQAVKYVLCYCNGGCGWNSCLLFLLKMFDSRHLFQREKYSDVCLFMKKWPFAYHLTYSAFLSVTSAPDWGVVSRSLCSVTNICVGEQTSAPQWLLFFHCPSLSLWDLSLCLFVYITHTHTHTHTHDHKIVKGLSWSYFYSVLGNSYTYHCEKRNRMTFLWGKVHFYDVWY